MSDNFNARVLEIEALSREQGLDPFNVLFEIVPSFIMHEVAAYGLPTRAQHWSYGKVYNHQRMHGEMGLSKIYEVVLNNDPAYAFLLDTNPEIVNLLVAAHVFGHVDFFKHNEVFRGSNRNMVNDAVSHALRVDEYIERYGLETVEHIMDIGFALDRHINPHLGSVRKKYPKREVVEKEQTSLPYADIIGDEKPSVEYVVVGDKFPPHPEYDLLWFLITYGKLDPWQADVLQIIREESYYFYPQFMTKVMNEGWASYWHAETFNKYDNVTPAEMIEFAKLNAGVVHPGGRFQINPYYLGYKIYVDIEKRWDELHKKGESAMTGRQKLFQVRALEDDISFIRNHLTTELVEDLKMFTFGSECKHPPGQTCEDCETIVITDRERDKIVEMLVAPKANYGVPRIVVKDVVKSHELYLEHLDRNFAYLQRDYADKVLEWVGELWGNKVSLITNDDQQKECTLTK